MSLKSRRLDCIEKIFCCDIIRRSYGEFFLQIFRGDVMAKTNVVSVVMNKDFLESAVKNLNLDKVNLTEIFIDNNDVKFFQVGDKKIPLNSFAGIYTQAKKYKDFIWLISDSPDNSNVFCKMKKFLVTLGVREDNIVNFEVAARFSETWLANLRYVEEHGADFFATGNEFMQAGLNMKYIPCVHADKTVALGGVNLADTRQDLRQSFLTARHVFKAVKPGTIKFVLIGLSPDSFTRGNMLRDLVIDNVKDIFSSTTSAQADLNFDGVKAKFNDDFSIKAVTDWQDDINSSPTDSVKANVQILKDYIELCLANEAKPVGVVFPFAPAVRKNYNVELLKSFRKTIRRLEESYEFMCIDMFGRFNYNVFHDMTHLNLRGSLVASCLIAFRLCKKNLIPSENFCDMSYNYFYWLSRIVSKDNYNAFMKSVFNSSAQMISRKEKIKIGFVLYDSSMWCGDELYNYFANDSRFEATIYLCLRTDKLKNEIIRKDFFHGVDQFKSRGLKVVVADSIDSVIPSHDVFIFLTPYLDVLPVAFQPRNLMAKTLMTYIPYTLGISGLDIANHIIFYINWKTFFQTTVSLKMHDENCRVGMPRGIYSGHPKMDIFFDKDARFHFDWKMTRPDAKKIIYAPHWSINGGVNYATFHWNYQFMYEFAKAHPEISWVVKPHPNLFFKVIQEKIFPSAEAFKEYLQKWDDLPNAQVYTGAYYQAIFATSDGMIHDSGSFIAEYQFVNKPMIYLTRDTQKFNELGEEILKVSYLVDGRDLDGIAALMQKVFIEGNDDKADARKEVFDKYLNYPKLNGMLASEFIYKSIANELKGE